VLTNAAYLPLIAAATGLAVVIARRVKNTGRIENVAAIAGFGAAAEIVSGASEASRIEALRDDFEARLLALAPGVAIYGAGAPRLPNTSAFSIPGASADTLLIAFDLAGVALSSGSA